MATTSAWLHPKGIYVRRTASAAITQGVFAKADTGTAGECSEWAGSGVVLGPVANAPTADQDEAIVGVGGIVYAIVDESPGTINDGTLLTLSSDGKVLAASGTNEVYALSMIGDDPSIGTTAAAGDRIPVLIVRHVAP